MLLSTTLYLSSFISLAATGRSQSRYRVCRVLIKPDSSNVTTRTYKEVYCNNAWCCQDGCCAWYINLLAAAFILLCFALIWHLIEKCWHKYCRHPEITNQSQEDMLMMSTDQLNSAHRGDLQNYGSNSTHVSPFHTEDQPPTYEEATSTR